MKFFQQQGKSSLKRTYLHESGNICACCEDFTHSGYDEHQSLPDDAVCDKCQSLCACSCHRQADKAAE